MCTELKIKAMRYFKILICTIICSSALAQENGKNVPATNSNSNIYNNSTNKEVEGIIIEKKNKKDVELKYKSESSAKVSVDASAEKFEQYETQSSYMRSQRTPSPVQQANMDDAVKQLEKTDSKSFEYHYFKYVSGNYNTTWFFHLKEAEKIRPTNSDVQAQMAAYYIITEDKKQTLNYLEKIVASGKLSQDPIRYAHDLLKSAPLNGVLVTHGFEDSYAAQYVQLKKGVRPDVQIVSLDFLQSDTYRKSLIAKGYKLPSNKIVDVQFLNEFCKLNAAKNVSISMTTPKEYLQNMKANLYVVGLVMVYSAEEYNNNYQNDYLWEKEFDKSLIENATSSKAKELSANYLPMLLLLRQYYINSSDRMRIVEVDKVLDKVAVQCNKYEQVKKIKGSY